MLKMIKVSVALIAVVLSSKLIAAEHEVKMLNNSTDGIMVFEPGFLKVTPGDTVTFLPVSKSHNVFTTHTPEGGKTWKGDISQKVTVTINTEGVYVYKCIPHSALAMYGVIQVGEATNLEAAKAYVKKESTGFAMNKKRLVSYIEQAG